MNRIFLFLGFILFLTGCQTNHLPLNKDLFIAGEDGYSCYRIPAIINTGKTILAFAEGRKRGCSDTGDIDLVMKRSEDGGRSWSDLIIVWDDGDNTAGNPAPVYDDISKKVILLSTWNLGADHESQIINLSSRDTRRVFVLFSEDEGLSWSDAREITETVKLPEWTWYATGPVHGIQIREGDFAGRLVIPCDHIEAETKHYFSHVIYSDDHGQNWALGGTTPQHQVNECTIAELSGGRLILNMRNYDNAHRSRKISKSDDGGASWSDIEPDPQLPEPICQASLLSYPGKKSHPQLYFLNPASSQKREKMTLKVSFDEGENWADSLLLHEGPAAYSDLCRLSRYSLATLFEAGESSPYEKIVFQTVDLQRFKR